LTTYLYLCKRTNYGHTIRRKIWTRLFYYIKI
jgi:hypothetical protein